MSTTLQTEESDQQETQQIQTLVQKNEIKTTITQIAKPKEIVQSKFCHICSPSKVLPEEPISFTLKSGLVVRFCNLEELNQFKTKYNY